MQVHTAGGDVVKKGLSIATGLLILLLGSQVGAGKDKRQDKDEFEEPAKVRVQHVLVGFKHTVPGKRIDRTREEAQKLAEEVLETAQAGVEFADLIKRYSDDKYPGIYILVNKGETPLPGESKRYEMLSCFGNVAFLLDIDEIGMAEYHPTRCKMGWHIIKRIE